MSWGIIHIWNERRRQARAEGFDRAHDATHSNGELAEAAASYLLIVPHQVRGRVLPPCFTPKFWPWELQWWKPKSAFSNTVRAAALAAAEADRQLNWAKPFPPIVCLCGSTRFSEEFRAANLEETLAGHIVLSIGCDTKSDDALKLDTDGKTRLDELHKRKIDLADEIVVLNVGGYVGESTASEIRYAQDLGKPLRWLEAKWAEEILRRISKGRRA